MGDGHRDGRRRLGVHGLGVGEAAFVGPARVGACEGGHAAVHADEVAGSGKLRFIGTLREAEQAADPLLQHFLAGEEEDDAA